MFTKYPLIEDMKRNLGGMIRTEKPPQTMDYMCIYALRQPIDYYKRNSSPVFICYLDASKAFDRVNHWCLFKKKPINRDVPITIIRLLVRWYGSQLYRVRWGDSLSDQWF